MARRKSGGARSAKIDAGAVRRSDGGVAGKPARRQRQEQRCEPDRTDIGVGLQRAFGPHLRRFLSTITTYRLLCVYSTAELQHVRLGAFERCGEVRSGAFIALV